ncbi:MAG: F0F1 ATP synthase subunit alpha, partial [Coraliomargarita sp.]
GFYDAIDAKKVVEATTSLREFLETRGSKTMDTIRGEKAFSDATEGELKKLLEEWSAGFSA